MDFHFGRQCCCYSSRCSHTSLGQAMKLWLIHVKIPCDSFFRCSHRHRCVSHSQMSSSIVAVRKMAAAMGNARKKLLLFPSLELLWVGAERVPASFENRSKVVFCECFRFYNHIHQINSLIFCCCSCF
jgi:hypothetical protein